MGRTWSESCKESFFLLYRKRKTRVSMLFLCILCSCGSAKVDKGHDCGVLVLQTVHLSVAQRVIIFDDSVAAELTVAKQAKERRVGEHLVEGVGLHVGLVVVVLAPSHTGKHEAQGVPLRDFGRF